MNVIPDRYLHLEKDTSVANTEFNGYKDLKHKGYILIAKKTIGTGTETTRYYLAKADFSASWANRVNLAYGLL